MSVTVALTNNGNGTHTLKTEVTGPSTKIIDLGAYAGEKLYELHPEFAVNGKTWAELTNQEKLDVLGKEQVRHFKEVAKGKYIVDATIEAENTAIEEAETKFNGEI